MRALNITKPSHIDGSVKPMGFRINQLMGVKQWALIVILSVLWGGSFFFVGVAVKQLPPFTIVFCRVGIAALILLGYVVLSGKQIPSSLPLWGAFFIMGALNNLIPFSLIVWGQSHIDSSLAAILNATTPIFSVVLAHFLTRDEPMTRSRLLGVLAAWGGVVMLIGIESLQGFGIHMMSQLAVLAAAVSYAFAAIFGRRFKDLDPVVVATGMLCGSSVMMAPLALLIDKPWQFDPGAVTWWALIGLAALSTALAYIIYFRVLASAGATNLLLVTFLIPVSAIFLGMLVLAEQPGWHAFGGMGLIFVGLIAVDGRVGPKIRRLISPNSSSPDG